MSIPPPLNKYVGQFDINDPQIVSLKNYLIEYNNNVELFKKESDKTKLDTYSKIIQKRCNSILLLLKDCSDSNDKNKCTLPICKNSNIIQTIIIDIFVDLTDLTAEPKKSYSFMPLLLLNSLSTMVCSNISNKNNADGKYYLCGSNSIRPPDPNSPTYESYKELISTAVEQQESRDSSITLNTLLIYLGYSAAGLVVIIIGILIYQRFGKKPIKELEKKLGGYINKMLK